MMTDGAVKPEAPFKEILVWKFSRFTRKREHAVAFKSKLRRKDIRVVSITEQVDCSAIGRLLNGIIESVDEFYSDNLLSRARPHAAERRLFAKAIRWRSPSETASLRIYCTRYVSTHLP